MGGMEISLAALFGFGMLHSVLDTLIMLGAWCAGSSVTPLDILGFLRVTGPPPPSPSAATITMAKVADTATRAAAQTPEGASTRRSRAKL